MPRYFSATLLLDEAWQLDIDLVARTLERRFPGIGAIDALPGQSLGKTGLLILDNAQIVLQSAAAPVPRADAVPPLRILRTWDPMPALYRHRAHVSVTCGGRLPGMEGAQAYAAAAHFVAAAVASMTPVSAVLWGGSRQLLEPADFTTTAEMLMRGRIPVSSWVSYAPVVPEGAVRSGLTGMVTYGMRPFIGHELELAPRPGDPRAAYRCMGAVVRRIMGDWLDLSDGMQMVDRKAGIDLIVRKRRYWLRRDETVYVLVAEDSVVDPWSLRPRDRDVA